MDKRIIAAAAAFPLLFAAALWASGALLLAFHGRPVSDASPMTVIEYAASLSNETPKREKALFFCAVFLPFAGLAFALSPLFMRREKPLHGDARFASIKEIRAAGLLGASEKSILVGKTGENYLSYPGFQFVMLAAPTRSGKGVSVVVPNCLNYSDSIVVLDIKFENFDITAGYRSECGQDVYLFAPFGRGEGGALLKSHRYNPLGYVSDDPAKRYSDISSIAQALYPDPVKGDAFWAANARNLFIGLTLFVLESPEIPHTVGEVFRQGSGKGEPVRDYLLRRIEERKAEGRPFTERCRDALCRFAGNSDNTLAGILSTFNAALTAWGDPAADAATSANDFDLRDVRRRPMSIYLGIRPDKLSDAKVIVNLFFNQLLSLNTRVLPSQDESLRYQCLLVMDEFTSIGNVPVIASAVSYIAGYNMRLLTIIQNKSQLKDVYGEEKALTLMANHALMVMFAPSPVVMADAREYSEMLGYRTVKAASKSRQLGTLKSSRSESESLQKRALLLPQEIRELGTENQIISLENTRPVLCRKIRYYEDSRLKERAGRPVPDIPVIDIREFLAWQEASGARPVAEGDLKEMKADDISGASEIPEAPSSAGKEPGAVRHEVSDFTVRFMAGTSGKTPEERREFLEQLFLAAEKFGASEPPYEAAEEAVTGGGSP